MIKGVNKAPTKASLSLKKASVKDALIQDFPLEKLAPTSGVPTYDFASKLAIEVDRRNTTGRASFIV